MSDAQALDPLAYDPQRVDRFVARLQEALAVTGAVLPIPEARYFPHGPRLRVRLPRPPTLTLPPYLDPILLVWYVQTGQMRSLVAGVQCGADLGLSVVEARVVLDATDRGNSSSARVRQLRRKLEAILRRLSPFGAEGTPVVGEKS